MNACTLPKYIMIWGSLKEFASSKGPLLLPGPSPLTSLEYTFYTKAKLHLFMVKTFSPKQLPKTLSQRELNPYNPITLLNSLSSSIGIQNFCIVAIMCP